MKWLTNILSAVIDFSLWMILSIVVAFEEIKYRITERNSGLKLNDQEAKEIMKEHFNDDTNLFI